MTDENWADVFFAAIRKMRIYGTRPGAVVRPGMEVIVGLQ
jgi:hypothetical protein